MYLKLTYFFLWVMLLVVELKGQTKDRPANFRSENPLRSRSNVAYFNANTHQIGFPYLLMNKKEKALQEIEIKSNDFVDEQWTEWTFCSRSCGGGVTMRTRRCGGRFPIDHLQNCDGDDIQYKTCNLEPCPGKSRDFRSFQCSRYNRRSVFSSAQFQWVPFYGTNLEPCQLTCKASGFDLYKTFGLVQDGTKCWKDESNVCIDGRCLKVGCDQVVGSNLTYDACGVCGGDNSDCFHLSNNYSQFPADAVPFNYYEITMIPSGATHIKVRDKSENILALMEAEGKYVKYAMNGNWMMREPGSFVAAGTTLTYNSSSNLEILEATGPTTKDLHIMIIYLEHKPSVEYEYWLPSRRKEAVFLYDSFAATENISREKTEKNNPQGIPDIFVEKKRKSKALNTTTSSTSTSSKAPYSASAPNHTSIKSSRLETRNRTRNKTSKRTKSSFDRTCKKPRNRRGHFCSSDFAIHARVSSKKKMKGKRYRHDLKILSVYKSDFAMMEREYLWISNGCCPKLRPGREYLIMGRKNRVRIEKSVDNSKRLLRNESELAESGVEDEWRYETRLLMDHTDYWHSWKQKYSTGMNKLTRKIKCKSKIHTKPKRGFKLPAQ